ncbi:acyltransferase family protein [Marinobacter nauticus]|uniref:acyltransferase family protein n=1 Tax=Marinobacter nauticus TaxID=2743 RepID=UPI0035180553
MKGSNKDSFGTATSRRVTELDGLRGIAALWVVLYHLWAAVARRDVDWLTSAVGEFFHAGWLGVDIFFVLSGFVITHSVTKTRVTSAFIPRFILRRSIRIDPPYWAAIILAIFFMVLKNLLFPSESVVVPSAQVVIAHIFYLQNLLELGNISSVFWTLCLEFQFYIFFAISYYFYSFLGQENKKRVSYILLITGIAACFFSPILRFSSFNFPLPGTIFPYAYEFILGIIAYHCSKGRIGYKYLIFSVLGSVVVTSMFKPFYYGVVPLLTLLVIYVASEGKRILVLNVRSVQFLGKISYSLYLTHAVVGWVVISLLSYLLEDYQSKAVTVLIFFSGMSSSILFAFLFFKIIEYPSLAFSKRFK